MRAYIFFITLLISVFLMNSICISGEANEIVCDSAIKIANDFAKRNNYDVSNSDIEIIKLKKGLERGPIRLVGLMRSFPIEMDLLFKKEFWVVFFYPKGQLEKPDTLGGDFCVLVDLYSGEVLDFFAGQ